jgi:hypothetical protein
MVSGAGGILAVWKLDEGLTVAEIRRRGGAKLRFVGYGGYGVASWGAEGRLGCLKEAIRGPRRACHDRKASEIRGWDWHCAGIADCPNGLA